jgi:glycine cleavage system H protein
MEYPDDLKYTREHAWVRVLDAVATVGITDFAQDELGDIVYLQLPEAGVAVRQTVSMGEVESIKSVSELICPISGEVLERNGAALEKPELVNSDPYGNGWLVRIRISDESELANLLSASEYSATAGQ